MSEETQALTDIEIEALTEKLGTPFIQEIEDIPYWALDLSIDFYDCHIFVFDFL